MRLLLLCQTKEVIILLMGVSGSGKTTVGSLLAERLGWPFFDADVFHPQTNIDKMAQGVALTDADRQPWLQALRDKMDALEYRGTSAVLTSSALKRAYREVLLRSDDNAKLVYLKGSFDLLKTRLEAREHHFFRPELLKSQFEALEEPEDALTVSVDATPDAIVETIVERLHLTDQVQKPQ